MSAGRIRGSRGRSRAGGTAPADRRAALSISVWAGVSFESVQFPTNGQVIVLSIAVQGGEINVPAEVLYGEANQGFAVRFVDMPDGVHELLRKELDRKLSG
jgi:hypothetical protein